jgi:hypothetical protein
LKYVFVPPISCALLSHKRPRLTIGGLIGKYLTNKDLSSHPIQSEKNHNY